MKPARPEAPPPAPLVELLDLRRITRSPTRSLTRVFLHVWGPETGDVERLDWIICGEANLRRQSDRNDGRWRLDARMGHGVTDQEEDAAYAFILPLVGVTFEYVMNQRVSFFAWVDPNAGGRYPDFHIPPPGYDPASEPGAVKCTSKDCEPKGHAIIERFVPKFDAVLYEKVRGCKVEIKLGTNFDHA